MTTILLGPQRFTITVDKTVRSLGVEGPIAVINSGWEEREGDDAELNGHLRGQGRNLRLYHRLVDSLAKDEAFAADALVFRERHDELRAFYGIRLQSAIDAVHAVAHRTSIQAIGPVAEAAAIEAVRDVDHWYADQLDQLYSDIGESSAETSGTIGWHRGEVGAMIDECDAVVVTGGNVRTLLRTLRLFAVQLPADKPVIAWSAGAMALMDEVVLFADFAPHGVSAAELHDRGLGRVPGVIALPHAKRRLRLDDHERMSVLSRRFTDHQLVLLDDGSIVRFLGDSTDVPTGTRLLGVDGRVSVVGAA